MPRSYVPMLLGLKLPEIFSFSAACGRPRRAGRRVFAARDTAAARDPSRRRARRRSLPIAVTVIARPAMYNGVRHFVFVLPPLAVLGGLAAGSPGLQRAARCRPPGAGRCSPLMFAAGVALPAIDMARLHPYEYVSFNHIAGGVRGAQSRFMLDYWGLAFKQARRGAARHARGARRDARPPGANGRSRCAARIRRRRSRSATQFEPTWDPKGADFALMLGTFYCARLDAPLLVEIVRDGVSFARAYDIRGRDDSRSVHASRR